MATRAPLTDLDPRFSAAGAPPTPWAEGRRALDEAELYWLSTVRPDGRPHVTPLLAVWQDESLCFCTGPDERKARNLAANAQCILTTGSNSLHEGLDVVLEGEAVRVTGHAALRPLADLYEAKYGREWRFAVREEGFVHDEASLRGDDPGAVVVYRVAPTTVFGFRKGAYSQTRWRF